MTVVNSLLTTLRNAYPIWITYSFYYKYSANYLNIFQEERFLFPIYPLLCLGAAFTLDSFQVEISHYINTELKEYLSSTIFWNVLNLSIFTFQNLYNRLISKRALVHYSSPTYWLAALVSVVFLLTSISRSMALFYGK